MCQSAQMVEVVPQDGQGMRKLKKPDEVVTERHGEKLEERQANSRHRFEPVTYGIRKIHANGSVILCGE